MSHLERIRREKDGMPDRELLLEMLAYQREQNGTVARIMAVYYGDKERSITGTKPQVDENTVIIDRYRTTLRVVGAIISFVGIGTILALLKAF